MSKKSKINIQTVYLILTDPENCNIATQTDIKDILWFAKRAKSLNAPAESIIMAIKEMIELSHNKKQLNNIIQSLEIKFYHSSIPHKPAKKSFSHTQMR